MKLVLDNLHQIQANAAGYATYNMHIQPIVPAWSL